MAETLSFELVSPERLLISEQVEMVVVPGSEGDFGVLPRHSDLVSTVRPGVVSVYKDRAQGPSDQVFVTGGFAEVSPKGCTVLVDEAFPMSSVTKEFVAQRAAEARELAEDAATDEDRRKAAHAAEVAAALARAAA
jgi:F-type H+-transporting ATPase subunit epsilon